MFKEGDLVIVEQDHYALDPDKLQTPEQTVRAEDNYLIPKHTTGVVLEKQIYTDLQFLHVSWGTPYKGEVYVISSDKIILFDDFLEKIDND